MAPTRKGAFSVFMKPDLDKVKAAVARYANKAKRTSTSPGPGTDAKPETRKQAPTDAALRRPLKGRTYGCSGFSHPNFLNHD